MKRISEHELMDDVSQAKAYAEADFSEAHNAFVEYFKVRFSDFSSGEALDLGCGTCDVIIRFAQAFPKTHIIGVDGAQAMLDLGLCELQAKGFAHQITLQRYKLPDMDLLRPDNQDKARELVQQYAADDSPILQKDFYNSLLAAYNVEEVGQQLNAAGLGYLTTEIVSDRHVSVWGRKEK